MIDTGKRLSPEQIAQVKTLAAMPVMYLSGGHPIGGDETPSQMVHRFALEAGLPEISGYYGADLRDGKIVRL